MTGGVDVHGVGLQDGAPADEAPPRATVGGDKANVPSALWLRTCGQQTHGPAQRRRWTRQEQDGGSPGATTRTVGRDGGQSGAGSAGFDQL